MENNLIYNAAWGSHLCVFYKGRDELTEALVPYFKAGLENNEFCLWALPDSFGVEAAVLALNREGVNPYDCINGGKIEIRNYRDYYIKDGVFSAFDMIDWWLKKEKEALGLGFSGMRVAGDGTDLFNAQAFKMNLYEKEINNNIEKTKIKAICTYSLDRIDTPNILNIIAYHHSTIVNRSSGWEIFNASDINNQFV